jgi:hypothetical protein
MSQQGTPEDDTTMRRGPVPEDTEGHLNVADKQAGFRNEDEQPGVKSKQHDEEGGAGLGAARS